MNRNIRSLMVFAFDLLAMIVAWVGGYLLRFNFVWPHQYTDLILSGGAILLPLHAIICRWAGLYLGMWVFASLPDLRRVLKAVAASTLMLGVMMLLYRPTALLIPRSLLVLYPLLLLIVMGGGRVAYRMWKEHRLYGGLIAQGKPVVIVGAGRGGAILVKELERSPDWRVVGLVDDDPLKWGRELAGHTVHGPVSSLPEVLNAEKARHVILAMPSAARTSIRAATDLAASAGAEVFTVPGIEDVMSGKVSIEALRKVEIEDLLGREAVQLDNEGLQHLIAGRTVFVSGAGGSIGSELCVQIARLRPASLVLFEASEFALYRIEQRLQALHPGLALTCLIGDVKDADRMRSVLHGETPQVVFHAAAYKHVPLMESDNAAEALRNNTLGTLVIARAAVAAGVERFVMVSTDKAVNPTNVMGASKRLAEMVCQAMQGTGETHFVCVRFGNVLGSSGSVIPRFQEQIARGGPVTVTHPDIIRYFMSIPEAAQLVLQAALMGEGGEIFVLDMGEPVRIADLARDMIRLSGASESEVKIEFTGLRPGEKLYEELLASDETTRPTHHPKVRIARARAIDDALWLGRLERWLTGPLPAEPAAVRAELAQWVPEYAPQGDGPAPSPAPSGEVRSGTGT
ncbi:MAG: polysaccharide biosynthesis protein [Methyloversatilis discipulorum]|uniref:polysaccharide biosynthesis protein n=1 Tax=Methyloversatilis discipulorum TaxID=1119528 RepID=UPI0026EA5F9F|nr:nucleoside-diphosphate sugar epimerase/dehydratase [Methyloversatilis discipulorum]MBV5287121.1 polysaccharide biosynthesis protein [Methyloversatilis discipulorum]